MSKLYQYNQKKYSPEFTEAGIIKNGRTHGRSMLDTMSKIKYGDIVMFVERFTYKNIDHRVMAEMLAARQMTIEGRDCMTPDCLLAQEQMRNDSILGGNFLHPTGKLIWISDIDLKYFKKIL